MSYPPQPGPHDAPPPYGGPPPHQPYGAPPPNQTYGAPQPGWGPPPQQGGNKALLIGGLSAAGAVVVLLLILWASGAFGGSSSKSGPVATGTTGSGGSSSGTISHDYLAAHAWCHSSGVTVRFTAATQEVNFSDRGQSWSHSYTLIGNQLSNTGPDGMDGTLAAIDANTMTVTRASATETLRAC